MIRDEITSVAIHPEGVDAMGSIRQFRPGHSPFDRIRNVTDDGEEWWSGRELAPYLGYPRWDSMLAVIKRAEDACRITGVDYASNFRYSQKISNSNGPNGLDVHMTRYGCYVVALSADSSKPQVAAAKHYFAVMTRAAEVEAPVVIQGTPIPIAKAWSERFRESFLPHVRDVQINHPGCFTVVTTLVGQMLYMEDELIRHMLAPAPSDRPDVSIGRHWAVNRHHAGLTPADKFATLYLPNVDYKATVAVYTDSERGTFESWFHQTYLPEKFPNYLGDKRSFNQFGELPPASAAENVCLNLSGKNAHLKPAIRRQLASVNGFFPVGAKLPEIEGPQGTMFDLFR